MSKLKRSLGHLSATLLVAGTLSCGTGEPPPSEPKLSPPSVLALSTYASSLGSPIDVHGTSFPALDEAKTTLHFSGTFTPANGGPAETVDLEVEPRRVDASTLRWTSFGPYANPFSAQGNQIGAFEGTVAARVYSSDGSMAEDESPLDLRFDVAPSIIVRELQPLSATCSGPVTRALGGAAYRLRIEAAGFDPVSITYTIAAPALRMAPVSVRHVATGRYDGVGERGDFFLPEVPDDIQSYDAIVAIVATDTEGKTRQTSFAISVHRPIEVYYNGNVDVAEVLAPVPVSACIPGGESGRSVEYSETIQETRSRNYQLSWNESWLDSHTVSSGSSQTIGLEESNGVGFSTTDEENWNWSLGAEISGEFSLSKLVSVGMSVSGSVGGGGSRSQTGSANREQGVNQSTTTTDTEEASSSVGGGTAESFSWDVSSSQSISRGFGGTVIARHYGVFYRQTLRLLRRAAVVTYNQCGAANVVGDVDFSDWAWSPDLALATSCPPLPESNLPKAQCLIPPCGVE